MTDVKQAVILCAGLGSRQGNLTKKIPNPMIDVNGKPFLEHLLIQLKKMVFMKFCYWWTIKIKL